MKKIDERFKAEFYSEALLEILTTGFQQEIETINENNPTEYFETDTNELLAIRNPSELFNYIINHEYWIKVWSTYLILVLWDGVKDKE